MVTPFMAVLLCGKWRGRDEKRFADTMGERPLLEIGQSCGAGRGRRHGVSAVIGNLQGTAS